MSSAISLSVQFSAGAASNNVNIDGAWTVKASGSTGIFVFTGENVKTGTFGGYVNAEGGSKFVISGQVTGDAFTFNAEAPGTVVDVNGAILSYAGTISGNTMIIRGTSVQAWRHGTPVDVSRDGDLGPYKGTREGIDLSGTITFGCSTNSGACTTGSGPLDEADVDVEGTTSAQTTTDTNGNWSVSVIPGHYTITPSAPGVTFSPASLDVDVTRSTDGEDFTSCAAGSSTTSSLRQPLTRPASKSIVWSLTGDYCSNFYQVTYQTVTKQATVTWKALKYQCDKDRQPFFNARLGKTLFSGALVGSSEAPGSVRTLSNNSVQINVNSNGVLVLAFNIASGGTTGTVETNASAFAVSIGGSTDPHSCEPVGTKSGGSTLPHLAAR